MTSTQPNIFEADQYSSCNTRQLCWKSLKWTRTDSCATFFFTLKAKKYSKKFVQKHSKMTVTALVFSILKVWIRIYWLYHSKVYQIVLKNKNKQQKTPKATWNAAKYVRFTKTAVSLKHFFNISLYQLGKIEQCCQTAKI